MCVNVRMFPAFLFTVTSGRWDSAGFNPLWSPQFTFIIPLLLLWRSHCVGWLKKKESLGCCLKNPLCWCLVHFVVLYVLFFYDVSEASGTEALVHTRSRLASNRLLIAADKFTRELKHVLMELWDYVLLACVSLMTCKCRITTCAIEMEHLSLTLLLLLVPVSMHPSDTHLGYSVQKVHLNKQYYVYNFLY